MKKISHLFILVLIHFIFLSCLAASKGLAASASSPDVQEGMKLLEKPDQKNISQALSIFKKTLVKNPNQEKAHMGIVYARLLEHIISPEKDQKGLHDGLKHAEAVLKLNNKNEDAYYKKSQLLFFMGKVEEGLQNLKDALKQLPKSETLRKARLTYLVNMATLFEKAGRNIKARLAWMKLRSETKNPEQKKIATEHIRRLGAAGKGSYGAGGS